MRIVFRSSDSVLYPLDDVLSLARSPLPVAIAIELGEAEGGREAFAGSFPFMSSSASSLPSIHSSPVVTSFGPISFRPISAAAAAVAEFIA